MKGNGATVFSHDSDEWSTPQAFYDLLNEEFQFTLDPCATAENAKCARLFTKEDNGLLQSWSGETVFVNPPYSQIKEWTKKCVAETFNHWFFCTAVLLIPSRTDTRYWHNWVMRAAEVRFVKGRLRFGGSKNSAPFPSAVAVFRPGHAGNPVMSAMERA